MEGSIDELLHVADHDMHQGQPDMGLFGWQGLFLSIILILPVNINITLSFV
ncbi:MAG: hypothetical protein LBD10_11615 [Desulfobulbus sp.]|jgi:hypothetical protein|nr:hypothetical protein [Desulfobulbus sp.]MDR2550834.1 hypothetical protein [Desulfobulbus sp.]